MNEFKKKTDDELVTVASSSIIGTGAGTRAQGAQAELTSRLTKELREFSKSSNKHSEMLTRMSWALIIIGLIQLFVTIFVSDLELLEEIIAILIVLLAFTWGLNS